MSGYFRRSVQLSHVFTPWTAIDPNNFTYVIIYVTSGADSCDFNAPIGTSDNYTKVIPTL